MISWKGEMKVDLQIEEAESKRQKHFSFVQRCSIQLTWKDKLAINPKR